MAGFDPSVISQIPDGAPNPAQAEQNAYSLYDSKNRVQLNSLTLQDAKQEQADKLSGRKILQGQDLSTEKGVNEASEKLSQAGLYDQAMKVKKDASAQQGVDLDNQIKKLQVAQEQGAPIVASLDSVLGDLAPMKALVDQGKMTQGDLDSLTKRKALPELQRLAQDNPALAPYLAKFLQNPQSLTYAGLESQEKQTKLGREMLTQRLTEARAAQGEKRLSQADERNEQSNRRLEGYLANISSENEKRKADEKDKADRKLDPDTARFIAQQYVDTGDKSVFTGLGRSAGDMALARKSVREYAESKNMTPAQVSAKVAEFNGYMSEERALGNRQAAIDSAASEAGKVIPIAKSASDAVPREKWVPINKIVQAGKVITSDKDLAKFGQANLTLANVYSRAMNPTGAATVSGRDHALEQLGTAASQDAYNGVLEILAQEIDAAKSAPPEIRKEVFNEIASGKADHSTIMSQLFPADKDVTTQSAKHPGQQSSGPTGLTPAKTATKPKTDDELLSHYGGQ